MDVQQHVPQHKSIEKWEVDPEKKKKIIFAAEQYLKGGKTVEQIAKSIGLSESALWKILMKMSGDK